MVRIGLIGAGYWGSNVAASFEATRSAEIAWICDVEEDRANRFATDRPHAQTTKMLKDVLEDASVSAVAISTPTSTHHTLAKQALIAGKHVFVEKPIAASVAEALDLVEAARHSSRILMVGHVFEYNSTLTAVKRMIQRGELGEVHYFHFERTNLGPVRTDVNALWDLASHDVSIMCDLTDASPVDVTASGQAFLNRGIEDVVFATFSFANGAKAHVHASWLNPRKVRQMAVVGSRKMLVWDDLDLQMPVRVFDKRVDTIGSNLLSGDFFDAQDADSRPRGIHPKFASKPAAAGRVRAFPGLYSHWKAPQERRRVRPPRGARAGCGDAEPEEWQYDRLYRTEHLSSGFLKRATAQNEVLRFASSGACRRCSWDAIGGSFPNSSCDDDGSTDRTAKQIFTEAMFSRIFSLSLEIKR